MIVLLYSIKGDENIGKNEHAGVIRNLTRIGTITKGFAHPDGEGPIRLGKGEEKKPRAVVSMKDGEPRIIIFGYDGVENRVLKGDIPISGIKMAS